MKSHICARIISGTITDGQAQYNVESIGKRSPLQIAIWTTGEIAVGGFG